LLVRQGRSAEVLRAVLRETGADAVFWNRLYEPAARRRDGRVAAALRRQGVTVETFNAGLLWEPDDILNGQGRPFQVFTPFWRQCEVRVPAPPLPAPKIILGVERVNVPATFGAECVNNPEATGTVTGSAPEEVASRWAAAWQPGEAGAQARLREFLAGSAADYPRRRDQPALPGTSRLSPQLHFGELSPRQVWHAVQAAAGGWRRAAGAFRRQLAWREFAHHLLWHFPHTPEQPLRAAYARFPWRRDASALRAWQRGQTGFPLVDAGMRELAQTGWMHNRVRMVVASFLVKDLLLPWTAGARWFWETLVDADLANNTLGWQWAAGCGADAAPYFRVFNPVLQGRKFDPAGDYVRRWVPELARLDARWIHRPWQAPAAALQCAGVVLGRTYPRPIVDHAAARLRALDAFYRM